MDREQLIDLAAKVFAEVEPDTEWTPLDEREWYTRRAREVVDAILPQATTVEELEALPQGTILVSAGGTIITRAAGPLDREKLAIRAAVALLPLTVVWRP